jgi:hypothetical protein
MMRADITTDVASYKMKETRRIKKGFDCAQGGFVAAQRRVLPCRKRLENLLRKVKSFLKN